MSRRVLIILVGLALFVFILELDLTPPTISSVNYTISPEKISLTASIHDASGISRVLAEALGVNRTMSFNGSIYKVEIANIKLYEIDSLSVRIFAYDAHGNVAVKQITIVPSIEERFISYSVSKGFGESTARRFYSEYEELVRDLYQRNASVLLPCLELYSRNATAFAEIYKSAHKDTQTFIILVTDMRFIKFFKDHPDCLSLKPDTEEALLVGGSHYFLPSSQDIYELWKYLIYEYDNKTISDYYYLFKAAVDIYSDFFMYTTSEPVPYGQATNPSIDLNEKLLLKNIIDLFIKWNENHELFVNLKTLEPIKELSINANSTYEYLKCLLDISTGGWHLPNTSISIIGDESWYSNANWFNDALNHRWSPNYVVFLVTKNYFENILPKRHDEIWKKMKSEDMKGVFAMLFNVYKNDNITTFDVTVYAVHHLSLTLHNKGNCVLNTAEKLTDLKSVGLASVTADYFLSNTGHSDIAPWFSKYYILSQEKYGGALNYNNFMVIVPSNLKWAKESIWSWIKIRLPWDTIKVYETSYYEVNMRILEGPVFPIKTGKRANITIEITIISRNGFSLPVNIQFDSTGAWAPYPNWVENSMNCSVTIQNTTLIPPPNGIVSTYAKVSVVPKFAGKHFIIFKVSCPSKSMSDYDWIIVEVVND